MGSLKKEMLVWGLLFLIRLIFFWKGVVEVFWFRKDRFLFLVLGNFEKFGDVF